MAQGTAEHQGHTNRLASEESPYLLQHAHNPVDWYPWGDGAFEKARMENKPIFLSVGYSTCHCHVMERESFENEAIAKLLNERFVSIKVDREERPDVDRVYMQYVQATTGGGGWPMSVFLTPDLQPFMGATYFPPRDAFGRPGFPTVLERITELWHTKEDMIREQSADVFAQLQEVTRPKTHFEGPVNRHKPWGLPSSASSRPNFRFPNKAELRRSLPDDAAARALDSCAHMLASRYDAKLGGFGGAPKFPRPAEINALLHDYIRTSTDASSSDTSDRALHMAVFTLQRMAAGGMYDHVGGGFHRYSVDEYWHVPHFEKMTYDSGQLPNTYLNAFQITKNPHFAWVARGILDYLMRDMTHPQGAIFSAEDADSINPEGKKTEGAFYLWSEAEIDEVLGPARASLFKRHYRVKQSGNADLSARSDPHEEFRGLNILMEARSLSDTAREAGVTEEEAAATLAESRELLHERRSKRPRPHLDDKIVTAWNGLAISAFANAARVLASEQPPAQRSFPVEGRAPAEYLAAAQKVARFVKDKLWDEQSGRLIRSYRINPSVAEGYAEDYAYLIFGLLDLHQADGNPEWLQWAYQLQDAQDRLFWDTVGGAYFSTTGEDKSVLLRMKEEYDGAEPAASSIAASNLFRLAALSPAEQAEKYRDRGVKTTSAFAERLDELALAMPQMCCALYLQAAGHLRQVVISGKQGHPQAEALLYAAHSPFVPDKVIIHIDAGDQAHVDFWKQHNPEVWSMVDAHLQKAGDRPMAFVCQDFTCQAPTDDPQKLMQQLKTPSGSAAAGSNRMKEVDLSSLMRG